MPRTWTPDEISELMRRFQEPCVLAAGVELDLFSALADGPLDAAALADKLHADLRATAILADALAALELLVKTPEGYTLAGGVGETLTQGASHSLLAMTQHQANCLRRWSNLARVAQTGKPAERAPSVRGADGDLESFIEAMDEISRAAAPPLIEQIGPLEFHHLLDVGGGSGTWTIAFLTRYPRAKATLFDRPDVIAMARRRVDDAGLSDRVTLVGGNFETDPLPAGADLALVSAIVHQNSPQENRDLYAKVYAALSDGGQVLIRDIVMDETRTRPLSGALFAVNMLSATPGGGTYTLGDFRRDLTASGFSQVQLVHQSPWMHSVVRAVK